MSTAVLLAPAVAGELGLTVWLLVKRVRVRRPAVLRQPVHGHAQGTGASSV